MPNMILSTLIAKSSPEFLSRLSQDPQAVIAIQQIFDILSSSSISKCVGYEDLIVQIIRCWVNGERAQSVRLYFNILGPLDYRCIASMKLLNDDEVPNDPTEALNYTFFNHVAKSKGVPVLPKEADDYNDFVEDLENLCQYRRNFWKGHVY